MFWVNAANGTRLIFADHVPMVYDKLTRQTYYIAVNDNW